MSTRVEVAFVMAAGLGKRLRPLTETRPKPLVPIFGKPLVTFALDHLIAAGVRRFVLNTHYLAEEFSAFFPGGLYRGFPVKLVHEPELLHTGGGIKNVQDIIGPNPFFVYSGDLLSDIDLGRLVQSHFDSGSQVTLALRDTGFPPSIRLEGQRITAIGRASGQTLTHDYANVSLWNPSGFDHIPARTKISFAAVLNQWIADGGKIGGVLLQENSWFNVGSPQEYLGVHRRIASDHWQPAFPMDGDWPVPVSPSARVPKSASLPGFSSVGAGCEVGEGVVLEDTILWPGAKTASRIHLKRCIVRDFAGESASDTIL